MSQPISEWMTPDPVSVLAHAPLPTCAALMVLHRFRHLPVINADGRLVGLVDDASVFARGELDGGTWTPHDDRDADLRVSDLATEDPLAMGPVRATSEALRALVQTGSDAVVVVDRDKRPVGILTAHDAVKHAGTLFPDDWTTEQLATWDVISVHVDQSVGAALDTMRAHGLRHIVVLRGRRPVAVVSWRDLVELDAAQRPSQPLDQALDMGAVEVVHRGAQAFEILERMVAQKVGCLPVVDAAGHLEGLVTRSDVLAAAAGRLD